MTGADPQFITQADWFAVSRVLYSLWMLLGGALGAALFFLTAHGIIPSLAASREVSARVAALRVPLYVVALLFLLFALYSGYLFVDRLDVIQDIYWRGAQ